MGFIVSNYLAELPGCRFSILILFQPFKIIGTDSYSLCVQVFPRLSFFHVISMLSLLSIGLLCSCSGDNPFCLSKKS